MKAGKLVVIGGDAAGMSAASLARRRRPDLEIEAYEMGEFTSYGACGMPYYVAGQIPGLEDLVVVSPAEFEKKRGIKVFTRHLVESIHPDSKTILVRDLGDDQTKEAHYDHLLIAVGAEPLSRRASLLTWPACLLCGAFPTPKKSNNTPCAPRPKAPWLSEKAISPWKWPRPWSLSE
ncbi:MAG: FAD-dependent oxidoreductase [Pseudomonadota bacterium]